MPNPNSPIVNAGLLYANGLGIAKTAAKIISMAAGAARDSTDTNDITLSALVSINGANVGANGVDIAAIVLSSFYAVYVIGDSTAYQPTAGLLSLSATTPSLPGGYDMYRRVGWVLTDGSANILQFWQYGQGEERTYYYDVGISELSGGSATTFTAIDLATSVPPIATEVLFDVTFTPDGATEVAEFLPFGSAASSGFIRFGYGVAAAQVGVVTVPCRLDSGVPKVLYKVATGDTLTLLTVGFKDFMA
jgi:hypothetical protein